MTTKHFYLVRHGETEGNRRHTHQILSTPLTQHGERQAQAAADNLALIPIDTLIVSDALRTQETAVPIVAATHTTPHTNELFRELRRAHIIEGTHHFGFHSVMGSLLMYLHTRNRTWHYAGGENFQEFRDRSGRALELLTHTSGENIVVVSHRGMINALRFGAQHGFAGSIVAFMYAAVLGYLKNGSITELTYDPSRAVKWHVEHFHPAHSPRTRGECAG